VCKKAVILRAKESVKARATRNNESVRRRDTTSVKRGVERSGWSGALAIAELSRLGLLRWAEAEISGCFKRELGFGQSFLVNARSKPVFRVKAMSNCY
jgi:hypothetical protein